MSVVKKPSRPGHPDLALLHQELSQLIGRLVEFDRVDRAGLAIGCPASTSSSAGARSPSWSRCRA